MVVIAEEKRPVLELFPLQDLNLGARGIVAKWMRFKSCFVAGTP
jgi:hypothetical protein